jgi:hypothetical protein
MVMAVAVEQPDALRSITGDRDAIGPLGSAKSKPTAVVLFDVSSGMTFRSMAIFVCEIAAQTFSS